MSKENVKRFDEDLKWKYDLEETLREVLKEIESTDIPRQNKAIVDFAKEHGYNFTEQELLEFQAKKLPEQSWSCNKYFFMLGCGLLIVVVLCIAISLLIDNSEQINAGPLQTNFVLMATYLDLNLAL